MIKYSVLLCSNKILEITDKKTKSLQRNVIRNDGPFVFSKYDFYEKIDEEILLMEFYE